MALGMNDFRSIVIKADAANTSIAPIRLSQNDQDGRRIVFELWDGAESIAATGLTARLLFGVGEGGYATMSAVTGAATATWAVDVPQEALQTAGVVRMAVEVASGTQAVCTRIFDAVVEPALIDEDSPEAQDALSEFRAAVARLEDFTVPVVASKGGTGRTTLTSNAVLADNGTGQVKQIATASGALFATAANGAASFGTLPVAQGGTGATTAAAARTALEITPANIGAIPLTGTAATGNLGVKSSNIDRDGENPSTTQTGNTLYLCDKDGERIGMFRVSQDTRGTMQMALAAFSEDDGGEHGHWLNMSVGKSGACNMSVTDAAAWRSGLGVGGSQVNGVQLGGTNSNRQKAEFTFNGQNGCALVVKRSAHTMAIVLVDIWSTNLAVWGELPADLHFIRSAASGTSNRFTVQNNIAIGSSAVVIVGIGCTIGEVTTSESAIAENFTRTQMDGAEKCVEIAASASATVDFKGNTALIYGMRGATAYAALVDYWGTEPVVIKSASAVPTITKTANSNSVTIKNNHSYPMQFTIVSLAPNV